jgi:hypothetical protein
MRLSEGISKHHQLKKKTAAAAVNTALASGTPKRPSSEPHEATKQAIAKAPTK